jgi:heat shock protein HtpX
MINIPMSALKILLLFSILSLILVGFGALVGYLLGDVLPIMSLFLALAIGMNVFSYYKSDYLAIKMTRTKLIERDDNPRFYDLVKKVAEEAGIPMPRVGIMNSPSPNAFATGRDQNHAVVVATGSILEMLNDGEMEAVLGHEMSHITHRDILVCTIAATIATIISYLGNIILMSELMGGTNNRNNNGILLIVAAILVPIGATFVQLGISRSRELYADIGSVRLVKKPDQLISSLEKISKPVATANRSPFGMGRRSPMPGQNNPQPGAYSSLFIVNNFGGHSLLNLFSTHPPLEKRIEAILKEKKELKLK